MSVEPSIATAAALTVHWGNRDIEAVVVLLAEVTSQQEAEDIIVALLGMRDKPAAEVRELLSAGECVG